MITRAPYSNLSYKNVPELKNPNEATQKRLCAIVGLGMTGTATLGGAAAGGALGFLIGNIPGAVIGGAVGGFLGLVFGVPASWIGCAVTIAITSRKVEQIENRNEPFLNNKPKLTLDEILNNKEKTLKYANTNFGDLMDIPGFEQKWIIPIQKKAVEYRKIEHEKKYLETNTPVANETKDKDIEDIGIEPSKKEEINEDGDNESNSEVSEKEEIVVKNNTTMEDSIETEDEVTDSSDTESYYDNDDFQSIISEGQVQDQENVEDKKPVVIEERKGEESKLTFNSKEEKEAYIQKEAQKKMDLLGFEIPKQYEQALRDLLEDCEYLKITDNGEYSCNADYKKLVKDYGYFLSSKSQEAREEANKLLKAYIQPKTTQILSFNIAKENNPLKIIAAFGLLDESPDVLAKIAYALVEKESYIADNIREISLFRLFCQFVRTDDKEQSYSTVVDTLQKQVDQSNFISQGMKGAWNYGKSFF